jgi:hypothetical protein
VAEARAEERRGDTGGDEATMGGDAGGGEATAGGDAGGDDGFGQPAGVPKYSSRVKCLSPGRWNRLGMEMVLLYPPPLVPGRGSNRD